MASSSLLTKEANIEEDKLIVQRNHEIALKFKFDINLRHQSMKLGKGSFSFQTPARIIISGASESGKSTLVLNLIIDRANMFSSQFREIYYCIPAMLFKNKETFINKLKEACHDIIICEGLPDFRELAEETSQRLVILDDLSEELGAHVDFKKVINQISHHAKLSIIVINQNFFESKGTCTMVARNMTALILFDHPVDKYHMRNLSLKFFGGKANFVQKCFDHMKQNLPARAHKYICLSAETRSQLPECFNIRSQILSNQVPMFFMHPPK